MSSYDDGTASDLPKTHCFITTHDEAGKADFHKPKTGTEEVTLSRMGIAAFKVLYTTEEFPTNYKNNDDIKAFENPKSEPVPIAIKGGTVLRIVDIAPGATSAIHRTNSLDYGVVLEGEIELILEDLETGPRRMMKRGDVSVQRATMHAWKNTSPTSWARMLYALIDAQPVEVGGKKMEEDWGGIELPK